MKKNQVRIKQHSLTVNDDISLLELNHYAYTKAIILTPNSKDCFESIMRIMHGAR